MRSCRPSIVTIVAFAGVCVGCAVEPPGSEPPPPGVVFTYPVDGQLDVPLGARLVVSFSEPIAADAVAGCRLVGPGGDVAIETEVVGRGASLAMTSSRLEPSTRYELHVGAGRGAGTGDSGGPLLRFTTRSDRPRVGAPTLIALNGSDPSTPGALRPIFEVSTLALVFSEPLDPRTVTMEPGALELVAAGDTTAVPATLVASGIHVAIDPREPLIPGVTYELRIGDRLVDLGGERVAPTVVAFTPTGSTGGGSIRQTFRTRQVGDPVDAIARTDTPNAMEVAHPLIGRVSAAVRPGLLDSELGDPRALDGPIGFRIPRGQRLASAGLEVALAGAIPSGLTTGDIWIELLTDGGGRIYRNRHRPADTLPDNTHAPLLVDLSFDLAVYAADPTGNAVLAQSVLGVQLTGVVLADEGVLAIETMGALDIDLLGMGSAVTNIVLDLVSAPGADAAVDAQPPRLLGSSPAADTAEWAVDDGLELLFDEPIDLDRARDGGIVLYDDSGAVVRSTIESHGALVVVRPRAALAPGAGYRVALSGVSDLAGNALAASELAIGTPPAIATDVPPSVVAVQPGAPCALVGAGPDRAGRCAGGAPGDDAYRPFALTADQRIAVVFDQPVRASSLTLGSACDTGSVRVERVDELGACADVVPGSLLVHARDLAFVPDRGWEPGASYRLRLVSGVDGICDAGEVCGIGGRPASFDPLAGTAAGGRGGPDLVSRFVGAEGDGATTLFAATSPIADLNGSGRLEPGESARDDNRVALRIAGTSGLIDTARFGGDDCLPETPEIEACMFVLGAIPARLGARRDGCVLPDGSTAATCVPVTMSPQAMYSTSVAMVAGALGIGLPTETGMSVMRMREPPDGPLEGFIVDRGGVPTMVVALELYMDAPDMSLPLVQHDLHSKPLSVALEGPLTFGRDGRIAIALRNVAEVPISVGIDAPLGLQGSVNLVVPAGEMRLQLTSRSRRGSLP